jgi:hypothetical protein
VPRARVYGGGVKEGRLADPRDAVDEGDKRHVALDELE